MDENQNVAQRKKPLAGITVLDFSAVFAGPICSRYLLDCGAKVIKVEPPGMGDLTRGPGGKTRVFGHFNAGKKSIAIDLKQPQGQELARQLIANADVLMENFRPGVMRRFGLDHESLRSSHPGLVYCSISGFGQNGPLLDRAAFAPVVHAASGFDSVFTTSQGTESARPPNWEIMIADILTGALAYGAIQTALIGRLRDGAGDYIDISMMEAMMSLIPAHLQAAQMAEPDPIGRYGPARTRDGFIVICVVSDKNLQGLARALDRPELLEDARFQGRQRRIHVAELAAEIEKWSTRIDAKECERILNAAGVPCSAYQQAAELFDHPQVVSRASFSEIDDPDLGSFLIQNLPASFRRVDTGAADTVPRLGEHSEEILAEVLGMDREDIAGLRRRAVIA